jgi:hypothetical protein
MTPCPTCRYGIGDAERASPLHRHVAAGCFDGRSAAEILSLATSQPGGTP